MTETQPRASRTQSTFKLEYAITIAIQAPPERLWTLLTTAADFPRWNSTVKSITGRIAAGEKIALQAAIAPERTFNLTISEFVPQQRMVWRDGTAPMFTGVRTFSLSPLGGLTEFHMAEVYSGMMLPMIAGSLPDFRPAFEQYAQDLKREAEKGG
jgi:hypothetical protein